VSRFDIHVPLVIAGGGACGMAAALAARDAGVDALILERDALPQGSTAMSQGMLCAAGTQAQARAGIEDSAERFLADILAKTKGQTDPVLARAIAFESGPAADWLAHSHDVALEVDKQWRPRFGHSVTRLHGWLGHSGADLIQLLTARATAAGADLLTQARLVELHMAASGHVEGVRFTRPDGSTEDVGCDALVLATCGFAANAAMVRAHLPDAAQATYFGHAGNEGDGIRLAGLAGAALADMGAYQGYGMFASPHGVTVVPNMLFEGGVLVNSQGQRFINEMDDISGAVHHVLAQPGGIAWVIYDARIEALCRHVTEVKALMDLGAVRAADDVGTLAQLIGCEAGALASTLAAVQAALGGAADPLGRPYGDAQAMQAPYRAIRVTGALYHTQGGIVVDADAQALRGDGTKLPNLFAGGGAARSVSGPSCRGYLPAMGLCTAITLGQVAGREAAKLIQTKPVSP
jgi:fumarate reductase flavoprotein subunit